jgi:hypothetical protein
VDEPVWLTRLMLDVMHSELLSEHGAHGAYEQVETT